MRKSWQWMSGHRLSWSLPYVHNKWNVSPTCTSTSGNSQLPLEVTIISRTLTSSCDLSMEYIPWSSESTDVESTWVWEICVACIKNIQKPGTFRLHHDDLSWSHRHAWWHDTLCAYRSRIPRSYHFWLALLKWHMSNQIGWPLMSQKKTVMAYHLISLCRSPHVHVIVKGHRCGEHWQGSFNFNIKNCINRFTPAGRSKSGVGPEGYFYLGKYRDWLRLPEALRSTDG
jgi:hypothetical protein